jgi:hypothetical protein
VARAEARALGAQDALDVAAEDDAPARLREGHVEVWGEAAANRRELLADEVRCIDLC